MLALVGVAALAGASLETSGSQADLVTGMDAMSIDTNIAGNDADTLGTNDSCVAANPGDSITMDVTALNIPADKPIIGFAATMNYDMDAFTVAGSDANFILGVIAGSIVVNISDVPPDSDGAFDAGALDLDTDVTEAEYGSGVLIRVTMDVKPGANPGTYPLTLTSAAHADPGAQFYAPATVNNATVAVSEPCPIVFGDVDCSGTVNAVDALKVLRFSAGLNVSQNDPCVDVGQVLLNSELQGDVDCSNIVNAVDALKLLRFGAGLSVTHNNPCPDIGT